MAIDNLAHLFTGSEAMFADLGHFSQLSIKVSNIESYVYVCILDLSKGGGLKLGL